MLKFSKYLPYFNFADTLPAEELLKMNDATSFNSDKTSINGGYAQGKNCSLHFQSFSQGKCFHHNVVWDWNVIKIQFPKQGHRSRAFKLKATSKLWFCDAVFRKISFFLCSPGWGKIKSIAAFSMGFFTAEWFLIQITFVSKLPPTKRESPFLLARQA